MKTRLFPLFGLLASFALLIQRGTTPASGAALLGGSLLDPTFGNEGQVTTDTGASSVGYLLTPTCPPLGGTIFFSRLDASGDFDIYWITPDGSSEELFFGSDRWDTVPRVSMDGTRLVFMYGKEGDPDQSDIYLINLDGTGLQRLTNTPSRVEHQPSWSPDESLIAYLGTYGGAGSGTVWTMKPDGSSQTQIVASGEAHFASFGSDGQIYFHSSKLLASNDELYRVNSDGTNLQRLTTTPDQVEADMRLSPDGSHLVFTRWEVGSNKMDVWTMDPAGGNERLLFSNNAFNRAPIWSPDGSEIAFVSDVDGDYEIFVMNADGSGIRQITNNAVTDWTFDWADVEMGEPNQPPTASAGGPYLVAVRNTIHLDGSGSDPDEVDDLIYSWTVTAGGLDDPTLEDPVYTAGDQAGIFELTLTVTDPGDCSDTDTTMLVVYDADGGFVTGGGWIDSPPGAHSADPDLTGKATFGFVSKYKKGADTPTGQTEFQFHVADLNFHSSSYDWLVVAGAKAMYKGVGTINGSGDYGFMLSAIDAGVNENDSFDIDRFRIKIWDTMSTGDEVVYDNQICQDTSEDADPCTEIGGGSIVIHSKK